MTAINSATDSSWITDHSRDFLKFQFVYPVISRRSGGLSLGINLNQKKLCNYRCLYCQVSDKTNQAESDNPVWIEMLEGELMAMLKMISNGEIWEHPRFKEVPKEQRQLKDIAFAGNGEPTLSPLLPKILLRLREWHLQLQLPCKVIIITNGTRLASQEMLSTIEQCSIMPLEVWAKFDTAHAKIHKLLHQSAFEPHHLIDNLASLPKEVGIRLQTLVIRQSDQGPLFFDLDAHIESLKEMMALKLNLLELQLCTTARPSQETQVWPAHKRELIEIELSLKKNFKILVVQTYL